MKLAMRSTAREGLALIFKRALARSGVCLAVLAGVAGGALAQSIPAIVSAGAATANGSGVIYIQYDVPAPANVTASDGLYIGRVDISWSAVSPSAKYFVYRNGVLISGQNGITATSFSDTSTDGLTAYSYTVTASQDGGVSDPSLADTGFALGDGSKLNLAATDGTVTDKVNLSWTVMAGADGYKVYKDGVLVVTIANGTTVTYSDTTVAGTPAAHTYAVSAFKGSLETSQSVDTGFANVVPVSLTGGMATYFNQVSDPFQPAVNDPNGVNDSFTFSIAAQPSHGTAVITNNMIVYTPNVDYMGSDSLTVTATDKGGATTTGTVTVLVDCPRPIVYGINVSDDLSKLVGVAFVDSCGSASTTQVQLKVSSSGSNVLSTSSSLTAITGSPSYYAFSMDISSLNDGTYTAQATLTDGVNHTASGNKQFIVDWNAIGSPTFSNKGTPVVTGTTTTDSFGNIGLK